VTREASRWARWRDVWRRFAGRGAYPHQLAWVLLLPGRGLFLSASALLRALDLRPDARVLEIGPGPGYFSMHVARAVPQGRLELVDLQREMLQKAKRRLSRAGVRNAGYAQADAVSLPFRQGSFDAAFLVAVLGETPDVGKCMASVAHVLRPGGTLVVAELPGDPDALTEAEVSRLAVAVGLEPVDSTRRHGGFAARFTRRRNR
jgi:ubiquinone/menaquinone biosynthesis C-methylase UbiE